MAAADSGIVRDTSGNVVPGIDNLDDGDSKERGERADFFDGNNFRIFGNRFLSLALYEAACTRVGDAESFRLEHAVCGKFDCEIAASIPVGSDGADGNTGVGFCVCSRAVDEASGNLIL